MPQNNPTTLEEVVKCQQKSQRAEETQRKKSEVKAGRPQYADFCCQLGGSEIQKIGSDSNWYKIKKCLHPKLSWVKRIQFLSLGDLGKHPS